MPHSVSLPHIYQRAVSGDSQDSLSIIAGLVEPGQTLLDLGMGAGGLGLYLSQRQAILADGVTLNQAEVDIATSWYRHVVVADLDTANLDELFQGQLYDCIVCADVLEHLKAPQNVLAQCKGLLQPGGRLITSVPNAGYCGLIAELIQGEFRYRPEGLLDHTHLRFFTRRSLHRFFEEQGWSEVAVQTTQRHLLDSEFTAPFDNLPPAVARHLLALPDAQTYQFVSVLQPKLALSDATSDEDTASENAQLTNAPADALFSAQLYLASEAGYEENLKLVCSGRVGQAQQFLNFEIAAGTSPYTSVRFDPADRPGFFRLFGMRLLLPDGSLLWELQTEAGSADLLTNGRHQQILCQLPWVVSEGVLLFLYGDDPWLELPLQSSVLAQVSRHGARLEVSCGWPMSADYLQASVAVKAMVARHQTEREQYQLVHQDLVQLSGAHEGIKSQLAAERLISQALLADKQTMAGELLAAKRHTVTQSEQLQQMQLHLQTIEASTVFRVTRPIVQLKMKLDSLMGKTPEARVKSLAAPDLLPLPLPTEPVDVIVPVYRGLEDTRCCVESVLQSKSVTAWHLVVINDCSPEPAVTEWLRSVAAADSRIELLENPENLGFVATVNRGMALHPDRDVLLLNSDAEVANDWLDRLQHAAYSQPKVSSVTPFSNNATICSYPRFCQPNELPADIDTAGLDQLFAQHLAGQTLPIPTGVGFCMYIRRQCLQEIGQFDEANFGKGYGEENDFCMRSNLAGWVHLHALDTFVRHAGGISFGASKSEREQQAMQTLNRLHPEYEALVHNYLQRDPAQDARMIVDIARIIGCGKPVVLNVTHNREGGTLRHIEELAHYLAPKAIFLRLWPAPGGVLLKLEGPQEAFELHFTLPPDNEKLLQTLQQLMVGHVHYHHLLGHTSFIATLPQLLQVTHDFTAHDYYSVCPQISLTDHTDRYCGETGLEQCHQCLQNNPAPGGVSIETWREQYGHVLKSARYLITPSCDTAQRMRHYVPEANIQVVPHSTLLPNAPDYREPCPRQLTDQQPLKIAVLGALSRIKGADVLEAVATLAARNNAPLEFHLIGYAYRQLRTQPKAKLTVHGAYDETDLQKILQWLKPDLLWFPAQWPETYSYTLSAGLEASLPLVAPDLGAFAERLQGRSWTWITNWHQDTSDWVVFFENIRAKNFLTGQSPGFNKPLHSPIHCNQSTVAYHKNYCPTPMIDARPSNHIELLKLIKDLRLINQKSKHTSKLIKSSTLKALIHLRATSLLSPMAKMMPMHIQRRIKSWLRR